MEIKEILKQRKYTIGGDPEYGLLTMLEYQPKSAIGLIGGTKKKPIELIDGIMVQEDGVALEVNLIPQVFDLKGKYRDNITAQIEKVKNTILTRKKLYLSEESALLYPASELKHKKANEVGCEPDYNVWTEDINPTPNITKNNYRYFGGHLHIGFKHNSDKEFLRHCFALVKACDIVYANYTLGRLHRDKRAPLYGQLGRFRIKSYGVEYRTPKASTFRSYILQTQLLEKVFMLAENKDFLESLDKDTFIIDFENEKEFFQKKQKVYDITNKVNSL